MGCSSPELHFLKDLIEETLLIDKQHNIFAAGIVDALISSFNRARRNPDDLSRFGLYMMGRFRLRVRARLSNFTF